MSDRRTQRIIRSLNLMSTQIDMALDQIRSHHGRRASATIMRLGHSMRSIDREMDTKTQVRDVITVLNDCVYNLDDPLTTMPDYITDEDPDFLHVSGIFSIRALRAAFGDNSK